MSFLTLPRRYSPDFALLGRKPISPVSFDFNNRFGFKPYFAQYESKNLLTSVDPVIVGTVAGRATIDGVGIGSVFTGSGYESYSNVTSLTGARFSIVVQMRIASKIANDFIFHHANTDSSFSEGVAFWADTEGFNTGNTEILSVSIDNRRLESTTNSIPDGELVTFVLVWGGGTDVELWINGNLDTTAFASGTPSVFAGVQSTCRVGGYAGSLDDFNGGISFVAASTDVISSASAKLLSMDPFQLLKPAMLPIYFLADAAPAPTAGFLLTNRSIANYGGMRQ